MDNHLTIIKGIINHGITLDMNSPNLLEQIQDHFEKSEKYTTEMFDHGAFLVLSFRHPVAKITIENDHLSFEFGVDHHVYPVIIKTLKYLYNLRWN